MIIRKVTIITVVVHAAVAFLTAAGAPEVWGIEISLTGSETIAEIQRMLEEDGVEAGVGGLDLVAGLAALAFSGLNYMFMIIQIPLLLPDMAAQLGVPGFIITFIFAPLYTVVLIDIVAILTGDVRV